MLERMTELAQQIIGELTHCGVEEYDDYYSIWVDNTCGEDFTFEINKGENEIKDILSYCENFDYQEHFKLWFGVNKGEPSDPQTLLDNCKEIADRLEELANCLNDFDFETAEKLNDKNSYNLSLSEILEIVDKGYKEVNAVWKDKVEMGREEAHNLLGIPDQADIYFDFDKFADDLLESSSYIELPTGRYAYCE